MANRAKDQASDDTATELQLGLKDRLARLEAMVCERTPEKFSARKRPPSAQIGDKVIQLPLWADARRGVPNDLVRGALFTVGNSNVRREYRKNAIVATLGNIEITYHGEELRQDDEDVFLQLVHMARLSPLGETVEFTAHSLLKALRWPTNSRSYTRLRETINRLNATGLEVRNERRGYSGSLLRDFAWKDDETGESARTWKVRLEPAIVALFGSVAYTQIDWEQRLGLGNVAKWLHSFYYTHRTPLPMKVDTIHRLCGSATKDLSKFRQLLRHALEELVEKGFLEEWAIRPKTDLVYVTRASTRGTLPNS